MYFYEAEFQYILRDYLNLLNRIEQWQKSVPQSPQMSDEGFKIAQQFRLTVARPSFVLEKLDYIDKNRGGLNKFISTICIGLPINRGTTLEGCHIEPHEFINSAYAEQNIEYIDNNKGNNPSKGETAKEELENERRNKKPVGRPRKR